MSLKVNSIDKLMEEGLKTGVFPGASLLVAKGTKILMEKVYGFAQIKPSKRKLTKKTLWDIASLTKPFCTATLLMKAVQEKRCRLGDPLTRYYAKSKRNDITLKHLLNHTAGLPDWKPYYQELLALEPSWIGTRQGKEWIIRKVLEEPPLKSPGKIVTYSDLGYILLGNIIEKIYGEGLEKTFQRYVAKPLGLKKTHFVPCRGGKLSTPTMNHFAATERCPWRKKILCGEVMDDNAYAMGGVAGHAGLFSTACDIHRWILELDAARRGKSRFLKKETFDLFCAFPKKRDLKKKFFTLGFDTPSDPSSSGKYFSPQSIGHLGYSGCSFWWDLEKNISVILLTNRIHPSREKERIKLFRPKLHDAVLNFYG